jgi:nucleotide-binding universal stress UspA family protein
LLFIKEKAVPVEKILFPTKFIELSYESLESMAALKDGGLKEVVLCHVILREDVGFVPYGGYLKDEELRLREEAKVRLEDWQRSLTEKGISSKIEIHVGEPVHEILVTAEKEGVDLIIIGKKKDFGKGKTFLGKHAHEIIIRSKIPVLASSHIIQFNLDGADLTRVNDRIFELPLVVVDWSDVSKRVVDYVLSLKGVVRKTMFFHNIIVEGSGGTSSMEALKKECEENMQSYCDYLKKEGMDAEAHIGAGGMLDEILRVSRERKASMIIMGNTSKQRFLDKILHRSISYETTRSSELPTLLVP